MSNRALAYAENNLGVHSVYEEATEAHKKLDELLADLDKAQDQRRSLSAMIEDRGFELLGIERGKHADMSATALDQHMKLVRNRDQPMKEYRARHDALVGEIQGLEYDADLLKLRIKIAVARMEQLGGYLHYLGAVKEAETLTRQAKGTAP